MKRIMMFFMVCSLILATLVPSSFAESAETTESVEPNLESALNPSHPLDYGEYERWKESLLESINRSEMKFSALAEPILENEYLRVMSNSSGRFTIHTTGGDPANPNDNNQRLLYGSSPGTSYTTIKNNGVDYIYGDSGIFIENPVVENGRTTSSQMVGDNLLVQQNLKLVSSNESRPDIKDVVEIEYVVKNLSSEIVHSGVRVMLDTMLGSNDGAPFRISGTGEVVNEVEFDRAQTPNYWQAFDSLRYPTVISQGTFLRGTSLKPDKIQFAQWGQIYNNRWNYMISSQSFSDSAVAIYWDFELNPDEMKTVKTYYGLSGLNQDLKPPLGLAAYADSEISVMDQSWKMGRVIQIKIQSQIWLNNPIRQTQEIRIQIRID